MRLFKNRENMSFDDAGAKADQEFSLVRDTDGSVQYKTKVEKCTLEFFLNFTFSQVVTFSSVHHLTLHFPSNFGADNTKIYYIGLAGEFTQVRMVIWQLLLKPTCTNIFFQFHNHSYLFSFEFESISLLLPKLRQPSNLLWGAFCALPGWM